MLTYKILEKYSITKTTLLKLAKRNDFNKRKHGCVESPQKTILFQNDIEDICEMYKNNYTLSQICKKFHISINRLKEILVSNNIKIKTSKDWKTTLITKQEEIDICDEYLNHTTIKNIAKKYMVDRGRIRDILVLNNIHIKTPHEWALDKFSKEEKANICKLYNDGGSITAILKEYKTKSEYIKEILTSFNIKMRKTNIHIGELITLRICEEIDKDCDYQGKTLKDLINPKTGAKLMPDIFMPNYKTIIEYNGTQHYEPIFGQDSFKFQQYKDYIKKEYCKKNNFLFIEIDARIFNINKKKIRSYIIQQLQNVGYKIE